MIRYELEARFLGHENTQIVVREMRFISGYFDTIRPQICKETTTTRYTMELMMTKNGLTLKPGAESL